MAQSAEFECNECGADVSADDKVCPKCGNDVSDIDDSHEAEATVGTGVDGQRGQPSYANPVLNRYRDLYRIAGVLVGVGSTVKFIGIIVGSLITFCGLIFAGSAGIAGLFVGALLGGVYGGIIFLLGLLISAQGQMLLVQADSAVHTSPFMSNDEKAKVMSL